MTVFELYKFCESELEKSKKADAGAEARLILQKVLGFDRTQLLLSKDNLADAKTVAETQRILEQRKKNIPLQYILGEWDFYGQTFKVGEGVLIPRPETEELCTAVIERLKKMQAPTVFDLCAGSGCIGLAAASQVPRARVVLGEWSDGALKICRQNIRRNGLSGRVVPMQANALEKPERSLGEFQCIISNPPYIPAGDIEGLDVSVKDYEPHMALDGGEDGLDFYRAISEKWKDALVPGGRLYFEVGIGQADEVLRIMRAQGFGDIQIVKDLHDIPRVVYGTLCTEI